MKKFEIYVYEEMDKFDYLSCRIEKMRIWIAAVNIGRYFYQINFYQKDIVSQQLCPSDNPMYSLPGLILVDSLELKDLNCAIEYLINNKYFESQKKYHSFEEIKFYLSGASYKGKRLDTIEVLPLPDNE